MTVAEILAWLERRGSRKDFDNWAICDASWALRSIGRRSPELNRKAISLSKRLIKSDEPAARWVGRDALRQL